MNRIIAAFAVALCVASLAVSYSDSVHSDLENNLVRLHIIADSDSEKDQNVKLKVRDAVLEAMKNEKTADREDGVANITASLDRIEETANVVLAENGFSYTAKAMYGKFSFPKKTYKAMTLPSGEYYGVRIVLGSGGGQNWWCVLYPPMCLAEDGDVTLEGESEALLRKSLDTETYDIITGEDVTVKFKIVEVVQEIKQKLNGN